MHDKHYQVRTDATTSTSFKKIAFYYMLNIGASKLDFPASISFPHGSQTQSVQKKRSRRWRYYRVQPRM